MGGCVGGWVGESSPSSSSFGWVGGWVGGLTYLASLQAWAASSAACVSCMSRWVGGWVGG